MMMQARHGGMHGMPGMRAGRGMRGDMIEHLLAVGDEINLTDAQRDKLRQIRRAGPAALMPKRQAVMEAQMDLHDSMDSDKTDAAALRKAHDKVLKARSDLAAATFELRMQVREVLTAEQRQKLHEGIRKFGREKMKKQSAPGGHGSGFFDGDQDDDEGDDSGEF
jgi:Spy/CpxP family protein refolding chaperone